MAKAQKSNAGWGELGAATLGVALGGVLGMLFAPKAGKQTRKEIAVKTRRVTATAGRAAGKAVAKTATKTVAASRPKAHATKK